jgi:hypothetical protein
MSMFRNEGSSSKVAEFLVASDVDRLPQMRLVKANYGVGFHVIVL